MAKYYGDIPCVKLNGLEKRLIYLKDYLQKYDGVSEQIYNSFSKEIAEIEEELGKLGG